MITDMEKFGESFRVKMNEGGIPMRTRPSDDYLEELAKSFKRYTIMYFANRSHGACFTIDGRELEGLDLS